MSFTWSYTGYSGHRNILQINGAGVGEGVTTAPPPQYYYSSLLAVNYLLFPNWDSDTTSVLKGLLYHGISHWTDYTSETVDAQTVITAF